MMHKLWSIIRCYLGFHGHSIPLDFYDYDERYRCLDCGEEYEEDEA